METSAGFADTFGRAATFESEAFDSSLIGANGSITFDYHMYGADIGRLTLQIGRNGIWTSTLWSRNGDQGNQWFSANVPIGNIQNTGIVKFRLRALANGGQSGNNYWLGDIAIDNIQLNLQ